MENVFILHSDNFGYDMYIDNNSLLTDKKEDAMQFDVNFDNPTIKEKYYSGLSGIAFKAVSK